MTTSFFSWELSTKPATMWCSSSEGQELRLLSSHNDISQKRTCSPRVWWHAANPIFLGRYPKISLLCESGRYLGKKAGCQGRIILVTLPLTNYPAMQSLNFSPHQSFPYTIFTGCLPNYLTIGSAGSLVPSMEEQHKVSSNPSLPAQQACCLPGTGGSLVLVATGSPSSCSVSCCLFSSSKNLVSSQGQVRLHY